MTERHPRHSSARAAGRFTMSAIASLVAASLALPALPLQAQPAPKPAARRGGGDAVTLNFVNAEIEGVARAMGAILKQQFVVDPRVKGTITLYSEEPQSPRDAYLSFLSALRGLGFTVVESGGLFKIVPEADAKLQAGTVSVDSVARRGDQVITQIFRLNHENANNLVPVLRPLISPNNTINANPGSNTLVITDYADNLQRIAKIIAAMDTPAAGDVDVITLKHAVAADIAPLVQRLADGGGAAAVPGAPTAGGATVLIDARSNSLLVRTSNPARATQIRSLVEKLDVPAPRAAQGGNIYVVYLRNADAAKLATVLRAAFGGGSGGTGSTGTTTPSSPLAANVTSLPNSAAGGTAQSAANTPVQASAGPSTGGFIQADPSTNSLVITAPEPLYRQVRAVIDQLDSRRAQVYVEALIVEVDADRAAELGIQWMALAGTADGSRIVGGAGTSFGTGTANLLGLVQAISGGSQTAAAITPPEGFTAFAGDRFGSNNRFGLVALARALEANTGANILSTPNLVTLDNEEAKIVVGQNVPFVTGSFTNTGTGTGATNPFQTIERKDVGLTLRIKPQIGEGNTVRMTIFQESSAVLSTTAAGTANAGPSTTKRSIESTVVVDDGAVLVLGGLIEDSYNENRSKVPVLGDIPLVGGLFRTESRSRKKTNLMVFLRPVVMRTQEAADKISLDRYDLIRGLQTEAQPQPRVLVPVNQSPVLPSSPTRNAQPITGTLGLPNKEPLPTSSEPASAPATTPAPQKN